VVVLLEELTETLHEGLAENCVDCEACNEADASFDAEPDGEACVDCEAVILAEPDGEALTDALASVDAEALAEACNEADASLLAEPDGEACVDCEAVILAEALAEACNEADASLLVEALTENEFVPVMEIFAVFETETETEDVTDTRGDLVVVPESVKLRVAKLLLVPVLDTDDVAQTDEVKEERAEDVNDVVTVAEVDSLNDGLPLDEYDSRLDFEILGLVEPEPDNEYELELLFLGVHVAE
jgi:hypothetical protein